MKPIHFGLFFIVLVASFQLGRYSVQQDENTVPPTNTKAQCEPQANSCAEFENLKSKLAGITPEEIRRYLQTANAEEKLKRADEILGKIMQVLVTQVGFRLEKEELSQFGQASKVVDNQPKASPLPVPQQTATEEKPNPNPQMNRQLQTQIRNARSEEEAKKVLEGLSSDFSTRLQKSAVLTPEQIRELNGRFEGVLIEDKNPRGRQVSMTFRGRIQEGKLMGSARVQIYGDNGAVVSDGRSRGDLGKSYSATENSIFIEIGGDYMELIYFPNLGQWMGSMLESQRGTLVKTGDILLRRR